MKPGVLLGFLCFLWLANVLEGAPERKSDLVDYLRSLLEDGSLVDNVGTENQALNERSLDMPKIRPSKRSMDLCDDCPHISLPSNTSCGTEFAPDYKVKDNSSSCMCLSGYVCCPSTCPTIKENACFKGQKTSEVGYFYTRKTKDCCECDASQCEQCPEPSDASKHTCSKCLHYEKHHQKQEVTQCWVSGCAENDRIIYDVPKCDTRCQYNETNPDECDNPKTTCRNKSMPLGCQPAQPEQKRCFLPPKQVLLEEFYAEDDSCKPCWKWVIDPKPEPCVQTFTSCPKDLTRATGVSSCSQVRDVCLPCTESRCDDIEECSSGQFVEGHETDACGCKSTICKTCPTSPSSCSKCETLVTVVQVSGCLIKRCVAKACPSLIIPACHSDLSISKDDCDCEKNVCGPCRQCSRPYGDKWDKLKPYLGSGSCSCYAVYTEPLNWAAASAACLNNGGQLASMETNDEWQHVFSELKLKSKNYQVWLGAQKVGGGGQREGWKWGTGGAISNNDIAWYDPGNGGGKCLLALNVKGYGGAGKNHWYDFPCSYARRPLCEFKNK